MTAYRPSRLGPGSALCGLCALLGCSADHGDPPGISGTQFSLEVQLAEPAPSLAWLFVVDDGDESRPIRESALLELSAERLNGTHVAARDPAVWEPIDLSIAIVRPSQGDDPYVTPADDGDLRWRSDNGQDAPARAAFEAALGRWLTPSVEAPAAAPPVLEAFANAQSLLDGTRAAASDPEQRLIDALSHAELDSTFVHSAREDGSPLAAESYAVAIDESRRALHVVVPPLEMDAAHACSVDRPSTPRFQAWLDAQSGVTSSQTWPCTGFSALPPPLAVDGAPSCLTRGPEIDEHGRAACVLEVAIDPEASCPNERGWFDPEDERGERTPRLITLDGESRRLCEIVQLSGSELDACRSEWAWQPETPGWCWTALPEWNDGCPAGRTEQALRLVAGANLGPAPVAQLTCIGESFSGD